MLKPLFLDEQCITLIFLRCILCSFYLGSNFFYFWYVTNQIYLIWLLPFQSCKFNRKYWKSQNLDFVHRLEEVKIELSNGYNGMEFARYILEHAQNLKKMVIHYPPQQSYVEGRLSKSEMISTTSIDYQKRDLHKLQSWSESGTYYRYLIQGKSA